MKIRENKSVLRDSFDFLNGVRRYNGYQQRQKGSKRREYEIK